MKLKKFIPGCRRLLGIMTEVWEPELSELTEVKKEPGPTLLLVSDHSSLVRRLSDPPDLRELLSEPEDFWWIWVRDLVSEVPTVLRTMWGRCWLYCEGYQKQSSWQIWSRLTRLVQSGSPCSPARRGISRPDFSFDRPPLAQTAFWWESWEITAELYDSYKGESCENHSKAPFKSLEEWHARFFPRL